MSLLRRLPALAAGALLLAAAGCAREGGPAPVVRHGGSAAGGSVAGGAYVVRAGDTVYAIARAEGVSMRALIDGNGLRPPYLLQVGQRLVMPKPPVHVVARGDTVYGVSRRYGVDMASLARRNGLQPPYVIRVGQRLVLPGVAAQGAAPVPRPPAPVPEAGGAAAPRAVRLADLQPLRRPPPPAAAAATAPDPVPVRPPRRSAAAGPLPPPPARSGNGFQWPVQGRVVAAYGRQGNRHNDGINIAAPAGTPVRASENGVVAYSGAGIRGYGNLLLIKHDRGFITAYAHNARLLVERGQVVRQGQAVATVGSTGVASPQLHFEIREGTRAVDPASLLRGT